jgi:spermidine/putrescine-binding protein
LAGCGGSDDNSGNSSSVATSAPAQKPDQIVFRFAGSDYGKLIESTAIAKFTQDTGVKVVSDNTDEYTASAKTDQTIAAGQRPPYDCQINNQPYAYLDAIHHYSQPISPEVAPNLNTVETAVAKPTGLPLNSDGTWPYVGIYQLTVPFVENSETVPEGQVQSWFDLKKPLLHEALEMDGAYQSTAIPIAKALGVEVTNDVHSLDPVWDYLRSLGDSIAVNGTSLDAVRALTSGQVKVAITPPLDGITAQKEGVPIRFVPPKEGMIVVTDSFYISKNIPENVYYYCQKLANDLLDPGVQAEWAKQLGFVPVNPNAQIPEFMSQHPEVFPRTPEQIAAVNGIVAPVPQEARNQAAWQASFDAATK